MRTTKIIQEETPPKDWKRNLVISQHESLRPSGYQLQLTVSKLWTTVYTSNSAEQNPTRSPTKPFARSSLGVGVMDQPLYPLKLLEGDVGIERASDASAATRMQVSRGAGKQASYWVID